jgi:hypothetical protein
VRFEDIEHLPDEAFGRPVGQGDLPSWFGHAMELGDSDVGLWSEHDPEHAHDEIELALIEWQCLGIAFSEVDSQTLRGGAGAGLCDEVGRDVDAADIAAVAGSDDRQISRAARHVENARAGPERLTRHKFLGDIFNAAGDLSEVAGLPHGFLARFDGLDFN